MIDRTIHKKFQMAIPGAPLLIPLILLLGIATAIFRAIWFIVIPIPRGLIALSICASGEIIEHGANRSFGDLIKNYGLWFAGWATLPWDN